MKLFISCLFCIGTLASHDEETIVEETTNDDTFDITNIIDAISVESGTSNFPESNYSTTASILRCAGEN